MSTPNSPLKAILYKRRAAWIEYHQYTYKVKLFKNSVMFYQTDTMLYSEAVRLMYEWIFAGRKPS